MDRSDLEKEGQELLANIKKFVASKDLITFTLFLLLSAFLWTLNAMKEKYETMVNVPVEYKNLPQEYLLRNELPNTFRVTLYGQGTSLVTYRLSNRFEPLVVDLSDMRSGRRSIATSSLIPNLQKQIKSETKITKIFPDSLIFNIERLSQKKLQVKTNGILELAQQYTYCDSVEIEPSVITAYGAKMDLDSMKAAITEEFNITDIKDTLKVNIKLKELPLISYSDSVVTLTIRTERFTEKNIQAPISVCNLPRDRQLRIFPSTVSAMCKVGLSNYEKIDASSFTFTVNYEDAKHGIDKLPISIKESPSFVFGIRLNPEHVDYIIEEKLIKE